MKLLSAPAKLAIVAPMSDPRPRRGLFRRMYDDAVGLSQALLQKENVPAKTIATQVVTNDSYQLLTLMRLRDSARKFRIPGMNHALRRTMTVVYGCEIGNEVEIGDGVFFVHPIGIVIGGDAKIGKRVRFMGNNTVGTAKDNGYPVIEDDVTIGAGARILGPIRIGARSIIGANSVVTRDIPPDSVVTGIPGRVVKSIKDAGSPYAAQNERGSVGGGKAGNHE